MRFSAFFACFLSFLLIFSSAQPLFARMLPSEVMEESVSSSEVEVVQVAARAVRSPVPVRFTPPAFGPEPVKPSVHQPRVFFPSVRLPLFLLHCRLTL